MALDKVILELKDIVKIFPGVKALDQVHLDIREGEIHALCGENGAGKSTLMKIISGAYTFTEGEMYLNGESVNFTSTKEAQNKGISMIYQEFNLIPNLTVAENIFLGRLPNTKMGLVNWKQLYADTKNILDRLKVDIDPKAEISKLSVAQAQMIEIAKCLSIDSKIIIMDEPTAALSDDEIRTLFSIIDTLKKDGISIIYISHRMDEIFAITDRITVFRDGKYVGVMNTKDTNYDALVALMVGKDITDLYPSRDFKPKEVMFEVRNIVGPQVNDVSFSLYKGEILGISGLMGAGNIEISKIIYGALPMHSGDLILAGKKIKIKSPIEAINAGIGLVPDDRKNEGLVLIRSVKENTSMASLDELLDKGIINHRRENEKVDRQIKALNIKLSSSEQRVDSLSGGNQQKVVFAKVLEADPTICLLVEPTRGVDVGAKAEIYQIMDELTQQGKSIILISSDLPELIGMSDRILVMKSGSIVTTIMREEATQEKVLAHAAGGVSK